MNYRQYKNRLCREWDIKPSCWSVLGYGETLRIMVLPGSYAACYKATDEVFWVNGALSLTKFELDYVIFPEEDNIEP